MKRSIRKIETLVFAILLIGTVFFVPAGSVNIEYPKNLDEILNDIDTKDDLINDIVEKIDMDSKYIVNPYFPTNVYGDNDDAGYKEDAGDEPKRSTPIFPNEMQDNWPGRGTTGKLSSDDDEDWYFFPVCSGQDIIVSMTPQDGFDFDIILMDKNGDERASSSNPDSAPESITFTADITNKWYLGIKYISGTGEGQYTFDVILSGQNDAESGDDAGDDFESATPISTGIHYGFLDMDDEEDWYKFDVDSGQGIHFVLEMRKIAYLSDFDIYLYNPSGELVHYENIYYDAGI